MDEADGVGVEVLPGPVEACEFAEMGIFDGYVVARIVLSEAQVALAFGADVEREVNRVAGHPVGFMGSNEDFDVQR